MCAIFLERFVFPDFCTFRFSNRAHFVLPDSEAIASTFKNRNTSYRENLSLFTDRFATDETRNVWWKAFLKKIRWKGQIDFSAVMKCIKENLQEYWNNETLA